MTHLPAQGWRTGACRPAASVPVKSGRCSSPRSSVPQGSPATRSLPVIREKPGLQQTHYQLSKAVHLAK